MIEKKYIRTYHSIEEVKRLRGVLRRKDIYTTYSGVVNILCRRGRIDTPEYGNSNISTNERYCNGAMDGVRILNMGSVKESAFASGSEGIG